MPTQERNMPHMQKYDTFLYAVAWLVLIIIYVVNRFFLNGSPDPSSLTMITVLSAFFQPSFLLLAAVAVCAWYYWRHRNIPPGPRGLPLIGYAPFLGESPQDTLYELRKQYGKIFSLYMGSNLTVVLNDYDAIKAAYVDQAETFTGRADGFYKSVASLGSDGQLYGVPALEGELWKLSRRFMLHTFRDLGMGKSRMEQQFLEEAEYVCKVFAKANKVPFDPRPIISSSVGNVICVLSYGRRFDHNDPVFQQMLSDIVTIAKMFAQAGLVQSYPILRFLPGKFSRAFKNYCVAWNRFKEFCDKEIELHKHLPENEEPTDYIDAFLKQQKKIVAADLATKNELKAFHYDELMLNLRALFGAGTETATATLLWAFLFMMRHPEIQDKIHQEIDKKIGDGRLITFEDKAKLPYTEAVIREVQRLGNVTPFGLLRCNLEETTVLGYRIPARSAMMPNYLAVNMDPTLWKDPERFKPERFLDADGNVFSPPYFMPFSVGKRVCAGETLARMEIFLYFANILQRFRLQAPKGYELPNTKEKIIRISCEPVPFMMEAHPRD